MRASRGGAVITEGWRDALLVERPDSNAEGHAAGVAVVTGSAKGIGRAVALRLARDGYDVALLDHAPLRQVAAEIEEIGRRSLAITTDVSRPEDVERAARQVTESLGQVRTLVNSAGIYPRSPAVDLSWDDWQTVLSVNLGGTFLCTQAFGRLMLAAGSGSVVNISSTQAIKGAVKGAHYAASKGGIVSLSRSLAQEWAPDVRVNVVLPGRTDTEQPLAGGLSREVLLAEAQASVPLRRIGQPEDVANAVAFLVSPQAAYLTGASITVAGGSVMA